MIHLECCETAAPWLLKLFQFLKHSGLMHKTFGKYVHVTEPLTNDACGQDCVLLCRMAQLHTNFHTSVQLNSIQGVVNLDASAKIGMVSDTPDPKSFPQKTFREVLYRIRL